MLAQDAIEKFELDQILLVPCRNPPHKPQMDLASASHRRAMLTDLCDEDPRFDVSDVELNRNGISYTIDTIQQLQLLFPDDTLHFVLGSDSVPELCTWHRIEALLELCQFLVLTRPGYERHVLQTQDLGLPVPWSDRLLENIVDGHLVEISSSEVRMRVAEGMSIRYLVPQSVEMYIYEHGLYTT